MERKKCVKQYVGVLLGMAVCLAVAVLWMPRAAAADTTGDWDGAKAAVIKAYQSYQTEVDVSQYQLNYKTEHDQLKEMMGAVVNETPYIFYAATSYTVSRNSSTNQIVKIGLGYTDTYKTKKGTVNKSKIKKTRTKLDAAVAEAFTQIDDSMTKLEKAMVFHDYLIRNTTYTEDGNNTNRLTEVGALLNHKANCQGYSLAYAILLGKIGVPVRFVTSTEMNHMWNLIQIGGKWYHVDVTWDDPVDSVKNKDQYGVVKHKNFLCSSDRFKKTGHYGFDTTLATDTKYDTKYWKSITSSFYYEDGQWIYMTKNGIYGRKKLANGAKECLWNVTGNTLVQFNATHYYFIAYNGLYLFDLDAGEAKLIWKVTEKYPSGDYQLVQIKYKKGYLYYRLLKDKAYTAGKLKVFTDGTV